MDVLLFLKVAPFVGAWIEITAKIKAYQNELVAPFVGAWIEIIRTEEIIHTIKSLRSSERGLKLLITQVFVP